MTANSPSRATDAALSTGGNESSTASHPFDCAVCHGFGMCDGGADTCDPTDLASHVHYDCMEAF